MAVDDSICRVLPKVRSPDHVRESVDESHKQVAVDFNDTES